MAAASNSPTPTPFSPPNSNAPQLESIYRSAKVVANICVYASPEHTKPIAIIVPAEPALKKLAEQNRLAGEKSLEELVHEKKVQRAVLRELQAAGKQGGLVGIEIIEGVVLADEEWTAANVGPLLLFACRTASPSPPISVADEADVHREIGNGHRGAEDPAEGDPEQIPKGGR